MEVQMFLNISFLNGHDGHKLILFNSKMPANSKIHHTNCLNSKKYETSTQVSLPPLKCPQNIDGAVVVRWR